MPSGYGGSSSSQSGGGGMGPGGAMPKGYGGSSGGQSGGGGMGPGGATPSGYGSSGGQYGGGVSNPFGPKTKQNQGAGVVANQVQVAQLSDILLRFFDFTVEEGHTYQYQVMVVLQNPNHKLLPGVLKDPNLAKEEFLRTAYSKPTEPVRVTIGGSEVIAGPVKPAKIEGGVADSATAILRQRDRSSGALVAHTFQKLEAGQVLNMPVKEFKEIKFEKPVGGVDALQQFTFQSDNLVLDLRGTGDKGWPGEMLLLDSGGRLVLGSEVGKSNPNFAAESARLESVYNQQQPTSPTEAGSGLSGFGSIGSPLGLPAPTPAGKKKPK